MNRPHLHFASFLPHHLTYAVKHLYGSVAILGFAISAVTVFEPIYLYTLGYSLRSIVGFYLLVYALYFVLLPLGAKYASRFGYTRSLLIGSFFYIPYYLALFGVARYPWLFLVAPLLFALQKSFYWPAYHADFARGTTSGQVAREIGEAGMVVTGVSLIGPVVGGSIVLLFGFPILFLLVSVLILVSNIPLLKTPRETADESFGYRKAFRQLFSRTNQKIVSAYAGYGEELIYMVLWPIFLFTITTGAFGVGAMMTAAGIIALFALFAIGRLVDHTTPQPIVHASSIAIAMTSFLRVVALSTPLSVFAESFYRVSRAALDLPLLSHLYRKAKGDGFLAMGSLFEMSLSLGKVLIALLLFSVLSLEPAPWTTIFLLGAVFALLFARFPHTDVSSS